jgi:WD40 repeat protein
MVVSADDRGKIKIWNIKNFKCMQTFDFTDKVTITKVLDMSSEKKIALLGSRIILLNLESKPEAIKTVLPLRAKASAEGLMVFSGEDVRKVDMKSGKLLSINYQFSKERSEVTAILLTSKGLIVTGSERGEVSIYCKTTGKELQTFALHEGPILCLEEDVANGLILTYSDNSGFIIIGAIDGSHWEDIRQLKANFSGKELSCINLSVYHTWLGFILGRSVFIYDSYQLKILQKFNF